MLDISTLGKKIVLKCREKPLSKFHVSQLYKSFIKEEREQTIFFLIQNGLIIEQKVPKPNTRKTPTYFLITETGEKWVQEYLDKFK